MILEGKSRDVQAKSQDASPKLSALTWDQVHLRWDNGDEVEGVKDVFLKVCAGDIAVLEVKVYESFGKDPRFINGAVRRYEDIDERGGGPDVSVYEFTVDSICVKTRQAAAIIGRD
jgi:hypothetical protein